MSMLDAYRDRIRELEAENKQLGQYLSAEREVNRQLAQERDGAHKAADWNMQVVADRDAEIERLKDEVKTVREGIQKAKGMLDDDIPSGEPVHPVSAYLTTLAVRLGEALKGEKA